MIIPCCTSHANLHIYSLPYAYPNNEGINFKQSLRSTNQLINPSMSPLADQLVMGYKNCIRHTYLESFIRKKVKKTLRCPYYLSSVSAKYPKWSLIGQKDLWHRRKNRWWLTTSEYLLLRFADRGRPLLTLGRNEIQTKLL